MQFGQTFSMSPWSKGSDIVEKNESMPAEVILQKSIVSRQPVNLDGADQDQERAWIKASQEGDTAAFNRLVLRWERPVFNLALRMLQDPDEASDVTQEVFLAAFRHVRRFRFESRFSTWLYRIAANSSLTRLKQRPVASHISLDEEAGSRVDIGLSSRQNQEEAVLRRERRERVSSALRRLSPPQRMVVELKIFQECKFEEIAIIVDVPVSTVKSRFYSSLEVLRRSLGHLVAGM